jgi:phosphocarrier protein
MKYKSAVSFSYGPAEQGEANAKSILSVLGACIRNGDTITLKCDGEDEVDAISALMALFADGLGDTLS